MARGQAPDDIGSNVVTVAFVVRTGVAEADREEIGRRAGARPEQRLALAAALGLFALGGLAGRAGLALGGRGTLGALLAFGLLALGHLGHLFHPRRLTHGDGLVGPLLGLDAGRQAPVR